MSTISTPINNAPVGAEPPIAELLWRAGEGDPAAWKEIVHQYDKLVFSIVRSFRLQDADTLDAVQATWLRLVEHAQQIRDPRRLGSWLITTARRECLRILRQAKHTADRLDPLAGALVDPSVGPEQRVIDADTTRTLWTHVSELPPRRQALLRALFTDQPCSYFEAARITGIPPGGIGPTRARALTQLRDRLDEEGYGHWNAASAPKQLRRAGL